MSSVIRSIAFSIFYRAWRYCGCCAVSLRGAGYAADRQIGFARFCFAQCFGDCFDRGQSDAGEQLYVSLPAAHYKVAFFLFAVAVVSLISRWHGTGVILRAVSSVREEKFIRFKFVKMINQYAKYLILLMLVGASACFAATPFTPRYPDAVHESWRWRSFPELKGQRASCLAQDGDGNFLFGTGDGIYRYDGINWRLFPFDEGMVGGADQRALCRAGWTCLCGV